MPSSNRQGSAKTLVLGTLTVSLSLIDLVFEEFSLLALLSIFLESLKILRVCIINVELFLYISITI